MWKELNSPCVYTLEASFLGPSSGVIEGEHFTSEHLMEIGKHLCHSLTIHPLIKSFSATNKSFVKGEQRNAMMKSLGENFSSSLKLSKLAQEIHAELATNKSILFCKLDTQLIH